MLKALLILILILILAVLGAVAALQILFWSIGILFRIVFNLALVIAAVAGIAFLLRKLRAG
jgi:hypothetical protein